MDKQILDLLVSCKYKHKDMTKRDIHKALNHFAHLFLAKEKYYYANGSSRELASLKGTLPVTYKNTLYNIPIQIYIDIEHPNRPPYCYVRPTPNMVVNVSSTVNSNGYISMPILKEWNPSRSDIYLLLSLMAVQFSQVTPLFSKQPHPPLHVSSLPVSVMATPSPIPSPVTATAILPEMRALSIQDIHQDFQQDMQHVVQSQSPIPPLTDSPSVANQHVQQTDDSDAELENCCPICLETIKEIKKNNKRIMTTICGHIICSVCAESLCNKSTIECPKCRCQLKKDQIHVIYL